MHWITVDIWRNIAFWRWISYYDWQLLWGLSRLAIQSRGLTYFELAELQSYCHGGHINCESYLTWLKLHNCIALCTTLCIEQLKCFMICLFLFQLSSVFACTVFTRNSHFSGYLSKFYSRTNGLKSHRYLGNDCELPFIFLSKLCHCLVMCSALFWHITCLIPSLLLYMLHWIIWN